MPRRCLWRGVNSFNLITARVRRSSFDEAGIKSDVPGSNFKLLLLVLLLLLLLLMLAVLVVLLFVHIVTDPEIGVSVDFMPPFGFRFRVWMLSFFMVCGLFTLCSLK